MESYDMAQLAVPESRRWLTTVLRPAGLLDGPGLDHVALMLGILAACSDMVVIDLSAATILSPQGLIEAVAAPAAQLDRAGRCLLLRGVPSQVRAELDSAAVPVVTLADDAQPTVDSAPPA
jgi:hypothetical protein